jgi:hypothetical protein
MHVIVKTLEGCAGPGEGEKRVEEQVYQRLEEDCGKVQTKG